MSVETPSDELIQEWNKKLTQEGLSNRRGESRHLVYGSKYLSATSSSLWDAAAIWTRDKRKEHKPHKQEQQSCAVCAEVFLGRKGATCCPRPKPCRRKLQTKKNGADISRRTYERSK